MTTTDYSVHFKPTSKSTKKLAWERFYVPGMSESECHKAAIEAAKKDYPKASNIVIEIYNRHCPSVPVFYYY